MPDRKALTSLRSAHLYSSVLRLGPTAWSSENGRKLVSERPTTPLSPPPLEIIVAADDDLVQQSKLLKLTVRQAYTLYVEQQKKRVGLMAGKGINKDTFEKQVQCLTLGLGLNEPYNRSARPIDLDKRIGDLSAADYDDFVKFWCNPAIVRSERTTLNYTRTFR